MTRKKQIKQASIEYTIKNRPRCIGGDAFAEMAYELNRNRAFEEGAEWADEHPINVWHNVSEKPELNQYFLAQIGDNAFDTFIMFMDENKDWRKWSEGMNIKMWAHINDLLPKGGLK